MFGHQLSTNTCDQTDRHDDDDQVCCSPATFFFLFFLTVFIFLILWKKNPYLRELIPKTLHYEKKFATL